VPAGGDPGAGGVVGGGVVGGVVGGGPPAFAFLPAPAGEEAPATGACTGAEEPACGAGIALERPPIADVPPADPALGPPPPAASLPADGGVTSWMRTASSDEVLLQPAAATK
jgi:hypothetical protein